MATILDEKMLEKIKKENYLYGKNKKEAYPVKYEEKNSAIINGKDCADEIVYRISDNHFGLYTRHEDVNLDKSIETSSLVYDVREWLMDQRIGSVIYNSLVSDDWMYEYNDSSAITYSKNFIKVIKSERIFEDIELGGHYENYTDSYDFDGEIFSYKGFIKYDTVINKLYLDYDKKYYLYTGDSIYDQLFDNDMEMPYLKHMELRHDYESFIGASQIMYFYKLFKKFQEDVPRIEAEIKNLNSLRTLDEINGRSRKKTKND